MKPVYIIVFFYISCFGQSGKKRLNMDLRTSLDILFLDKKGNNLLKASTEGHFLLGEMKLFFIEKGRKIEVNDPMLDYPRRIRLINNQEDLVCLRVDANVGFSEDVILSNKDGKIGRSTSILQLNQSCTDTIITEWLAGPKQLLITKAWYNGRLVYSVTEGIKSLKYGDGFIIIK